MHNNDAGTTTDHQLHDLLGVALIVASDRSTRQVLPCRVAGNSKGNAIAIADRPVEQRPWTLRCPSASVRTEGTALTALGGLRT